MDTNNSPNQIAKPLEIKRFYDNHAHFFDLSHPNLTAFLFNDEILSSLVNWKTRLAGTAAAILPKRFITKSIKKYLTSHPFVKNTMAFYETPLEYQLLMLDWFLKNADNKADRIVNQSNEFTVDGVTFNKLAIVPLVVDFGYNQMNEDGIFYNKIPQKPIAKQIGDLFYAIKTYFRFNLETNPETGKVQLVEIKDKSITEIKYAKLLEFYPFMGLNTLNYSMDDLKGNCSKIGLLDKYFSNFSGAEDMQSRHARLWQKMGVFNGKMYEADLEIYKDIFTGVKVYPPLGFDPFPEAKDEFEKVDFLYSYCIAKNIPIMSHCSDGGFKVGDFDDYTNPSVKWAKVLEKYPELKVCFAHFGNQNSGRKDWQKSVIEHCKNKLNVFTDISCNDSTPDYYKNLSRTIDKNPILLDKMMFGSDFSIDMLASKVISYNQYLKTFFDAKLGNKLKMSSENVEKYMFGGNRIV